MIPVPPSRLGLTALLCGLASMALAQDEQKQRSRTEPKERTAQPVQQRGAAPTTPVKGTATAQQVQQKGTAPAGNQKAAAPTGSQPKGAASDGKPAAAGTPAGQAKPGAAGATAPGGGKATLLASFNDWGAYASGDGRTKVCYALSTPKERLPKDLKRDPAYLFVSFRPADNVRNEVAVVLGFATRDGAEAEAVVGQSTYALITKGTNAWIRNTTEESQVIAAFSKGQSVTVKATSGRGNPSTDRYSLNGFGPALDRARKECS
jgi:Invasion associated locus B (IalB) protein